MAIRDHGKLFGLLSAVGFLLLALCAASCNGSSSSGSAPAPVPAVAPAAGAPMGALGISIDGAFVPGKFPVKVPTAFPTPTGGISSADPVSVGKEPTLLAGLNGWLHRMAGPFWSTVGINEADAANGYIAAWAPLGSWEETTTGVALIPIAGNVTGAIISTPDVVNSCAGAPKGSIVAKSTNPEAVCVANGTDIYLLDGATIVKTLTSGGVGSVDFTGGACTTCGVAVDAPDKQAIISVATADGTGAYQLLDLASLTLSPVIAAKPDSIAEHFGILPIAGGFFLDLSPSEDFSSPPAGVDYNIFAIAAPNATPGSGGVEKFDYSNSSILSGADLDSAALDSTGIILATDEFTGNLFIADLMQARVDASASPPTWTAPAQLQNLPELNFPSAGTTGIAVAYGAHEALLEDEFGTTNFGAIKLPSTSGSGTPAVQDWVAANMPNTPDGNGWTMPLDPHGLTAAFVAGEITGGTVVVDHEHGFGLLMNDQRTYVAVIDLNALLAAPRTTPSPSHTIDSTYDLLTNNVVSFIAFPK